MHTDFTRHIAAYVDSQGMGTHVQAVLLPHSLGTRLLMHVHSVKCNTLVVVLNLITLVYVCVQKAVKEAKECVESGVVPEGLTARVPEQEKKKEKGGGAGGGGGEGREGDEEDQEAKKEEDSRKQVFCLGRYIAI